MNPAHSPTSTVQVCSTFDGPQSDDVFASYYANNACRLTVVAKNHPGVTPEQGMELVKNLFKQARDTILNKCAANPREAFLKIDVLSVNDCRQFAPDDPRSESVSHCADDPRRMTVRVRQWADGDGARGPGKYVLNGAYEAARRILEESAAIPVGVTLEFQIHSTRTVARIPERSVRRKRPQALRPPGA